METELNCPVHLVNRGTWYVEIKLHPPNIPSQVMQYMYQCCKKSYNKTQIIKQNKNSSKFRLDSLKYKVEIQTKNIITYIMNT